jgi:hypothetical protein
MKMTGDGSCWGDTAEESGCSGLKLEMKSEAHAGKEITWDERLQSALAPTSRQGPASK